MHHLMLKYFSIYQILNPFKFNQIMVWTRDKFYRFLKNALFTFCNFFAYWGRFRGLAMKNRKEFHLNFIGMGVRLGVKSNVWRITPWEKKIIKTQMKYCLFGWNSNGTHSLEDLLWPVCNLQCSRKFETVIGQIYF